MILYSIVSDDWNDYFRAMDFVFEQRWNKLLSQLSDAFGQPLDMDAILFLVGLQELGIRIEKLTKDQKLAVLHVAICTLLEPFGVYKYTHRDDDGWPHFARQKEIPFLEAKDQERLLKKSLMQYFGPDYFTQ